MVQLSSTPAPQEGEDMPAIRAKLRKHERQLVSLVDVLTKLQQEFPVLKNRVFQLENRLGDL